MDQKTSKRLSWTLSILIHSVIAVFVVRASLHYILPEGQVTTTTFEVSAPDSTEISVAPPQAADEKSVPAPQAPERVPPKRGKRAARAPVHDNVKFMPDKNFNDVQPTDKETEPENPVETVDKSDVTTPEEKPEPAPKPPIDAVAPEVAPAPQEEVAQPQPAEPEASVAAAENINVAQPEQPAAPAPPAATSGANGTTAAPPAYGTPGTMLDESKLVERPGNRNPSYPWVARMKRQEGTVIIRAFIRPDGRVDLPILEKSSGSSLLDEEVLKSYSRWRYQPGASGWVSKPFKFSLTGK